jgi:hypothetical protein
MYSRTHLSVLGPETRKSFFFLFFLPPPVSMDKVLWPFEIWNYFHKTRNSEIFGKAAMGRPVGGPLRTQDSTVSRNSDISSYPETSKPVFE